MSGLMPCVRAAIAGLPCSLDDRHWLKLSASETGQFCSYWRVVFAIAGCVSGSGHFVWQRNMSSHLDERDAASALMNACSIEKCARSISIGGQPLLLLVVASRARRRASLRVDGHLSGDLVPKEARFQYRRACSMKYTMHGRADQLPCMTNDGMHTVLALPERPVKIKASR